MARTPDPRGREAIAREFEENLRHALPAEFGGLSLLIERLERGTAPPSDQRWAAKLLTLSKLSPRITEARVRNGEDWQIYYAVIHLLEKGCEREEAYAALEGKIPARHLKQGQPRTLNRETIKGRFLEMEKESLRLDAAEES